MNVHWHIGNCGKSVWFNQLMENADTYGLVIYDNASWAVSGKGKVYAINNVNLCPTEEIIKYVKELVVREQIHSLVIYTNYTYKECQSLFKELVDFPVYCRVIIMCKES